MIFQNVSKRPILGSEESTTQQQHIEFQICQILTINKRKDKSIISPKKKNEIEKYL